MNKLGIHSLKVVRVEVVKGCLCFIKEKQKFLDYLLENKIHAEMIGEIKGKTLNFVNQFEISVSDLIKYHSNWLPKYMK